MPERTPYLSGIHPSRHAGKFVEFIRYLGPNPFFGGSGTGVSGALDRIVARFGLAYQCLV
jgi:hypothetical protein